MRERYREESFLTQVLRVCPLIAIGVKQTISFPKLDVTSVADRHDLTLTVLDQKDTGEIVRCGFAGCTGLADRSWRTDGTLKTR
jgi:hypothetical protein